MRQKRRVGIKKTLLAIKRLLAVVDGVAVVKNRERTRLSGFSGEEYTGQNAPSL